MVLAVSDNVWDKIHETNPSLYSETIRKSNAGDQISATKSAGTVMSVILALATLAMDLWE